MPLDFRGLAIGDPITVEDLEAKFKEWDREINSPTTRVICYSTACNGYVRVGRFTGFANVFLHDNRVVHWRWRFPEHAFAEVSAAARGKFGAGRRQDFQVQNRFGAVFEDSTVTWKNSNGEMRLRRRYELDTGLLEAMSPAEAASKNGTAIKKGQL